MKIKEKVRIWLNKFINAYPIMAIIISFLSLIPLWIFITFWWFLNPTTFWEKLAMIFVGGTLLGTLQILVGLFGLFLLVTLYDDWKAIKRATALRKK